MEQRQTIERGGQTYEIEMIPVVGSYYPGDWALLGTEGDDVLRLPENHTGPVGDLIMHNTPTDTFVYHGPIGDIEEIRAGGGDDQLYGCWHRNILKGEDGDDSIRGGGGNDLLLGGNGDDQLYAGKQGCTLDGGAGDDRLAGFYGDDVLIGGPGNDVLSGYSFMGWVNAKPTDESNTYLWHAKPENYDLGGRDIVVDFSPKDKLVFDGLFEPGTSIDQMLESMFMIAVRHAPNESDGSASDRDYLMLQIASAQGEALQAVELHANHLLHTDVPRSGEAILRSMIEDGSLSFAYNG